MGLPIPAPEVIPCRAQEAVVVPDDDFLITEVDIESFGGEPPQTKKLHLSKVGLKGRHDTSPVRSVLLPPQKNREGLGNIQPTIKQRTQRPAPQYATRGAAQHNLVI